MRLGVFGSGNIVKCCLDELKQLVDLAKAQQCFLFEAITTIYSPNIRWIKELVGDTGPLTEARNKAGISFF